jgi:putative nucleotidyltransferase with HDIG domain
MSGRSGAIGPDQATPDRIDEGRLAEYVASAFGDPANPLRLTPLISGELARLARLDELDEGQLHALFELDVVVAGRLLQVAARRAGRAIRSRADAWASTGSTVMLSNVRQLSKQGRGMASPSRARLIAQVSLHCSAVARIAALVARATPLPADRAWLCGLLHDVSTAASLAGILDVSGAQSDVSSALPVVDRDHAGLSGRLVRAWGLPQDIAWAVARHHDPFVFGEVEPLAAIVCVADQLAVSLGYPTVPEDAPGQAVLPPLDDSTGPMVIRAREALSISDAHWAAIQREAPDVLAPLAARHAALAP